MAAIKLVMKTGPLISILKEGLLKTLFKIFGNDKVQESILAVIGDCLVYVSTSL